MSSIHTRRLRLLYIIRKSLFIVYFYWRLSEFTQQPTKKKLNTIDLVVTLSDAIYLEYCAERT